MKTHWKKQFNYDYMGSYSLQDGKDVILTIKQTKKEQVTGTNGKKEECFVCYFEETDKPMIMNRTNCKTIQKVYKTPYIEDWAGIRIQLGIDMVSAFGETVDALRIRSIKPDPKTKKDYSEHIKKLESCKTMQELQTVYLSLQKDEQMALVSIKDQIKLKLS